MGQQSPTTTTSDLLNELQQRVEQLRELNKVLAAEVDRQRKVVEAAVEWFDNPGLKSSSRLAGAVINYKSSKPK